MGPLRTVSQTFVRRSTEAIASKVKTLSCTPIVNKCIEFFHLKYFSPMYI